MRLGGILKTVTLAAVLALLGGQVHAAITIDAAVDVAPKLLATSNAGPGNGALLADLAMQVPGFGTMTNQYNADPKNGESEAYDPYYNTAFNSGNSGATITWVGPGNIVSDFGKVYLYVKDGKFSPQAYLFDLLAYNWDGMDQLVLQNFWPNQGEISHLAFYAGDPRESPEIPEPMTFVAWSLGLVMCGAAGLRRRVKRPV
jgi:hypothetical protein